MFLFFAGLHSVRLAVKMATTIKTLVSKKKQRYVEDGYNLDLSYINERVRYSRDLNTGHLNNEDKKFSI